MKERLELLRQFPPEPHWTRVARLLLCPYCEHPALAHVDDHCWAGHQAKDCPCGCDNSSEGEPLPWVHEAIGAAKNVGEPCKCSWDSGVSAQDF